MQIQLIISNDFCKYQYRQRPHHVEMKVLTSIERAETRIRLGNYYLGRLAFEVLDGKISRTSWHIVRLMAPEYRIWGILMLFSLNRYEELKHTDWRLWAAGKDQEVYQPKTRSIKILKGAPPPIAPHQEHPDPTPHETYPRYYSISSAIRKATPRKIKDLLKEQRSETHIFRHIETTYHYKRNVPKVSLRKKLGHRSNEAVLAYLHEIDIF